jgi:hypothetical protein
MLVSQKMKVAGDDGVRNAAAGERRQHRADAVDTA